VSRKITSSELVLTVGLLNSDRSDLALDYDGMPPEYERMDDPAIAQAYFEHMKYLIEQFQPHYLIMAIEVFGPFVPGATKKHGDTKATWVPMASTA
jgi:hypothetical protein